MYISNHSMSLAYLIESLFWKGCKGRGQTIFYNIPFSFDKEFSRTELDWVENQAMGRVNT